METMISAEAIERRVAELGGEIRRDGGTHRIWLIGVLNGTAVFLADLLRQISGDVCFAFIDVLRDVADTEIAEAVEIDFLTHFDIRRQHVFLLKDVVSTGIIETYLLTQLRMKEPASIKLVALLDRPDQRTVQLDVDYSAFVVGDGRFIGYGLEFEGRGANLPYIAKV